MNHTDKDAKLRVDPTAVEGTEIVSESKEPATSHKLYSEYLASHSSPYPFYDEEIARIAVLG